MYLTLANIQLTNGNKSLHVAQPNMCLKGFNSHFEKKGMMAQINKMPLTDFLRDQQLDSDLNCTTSQLTSFSVAQLATWVSCSKSNKGFGEI